MLLKGAVMPEALLHFRATGYDDSTTPPLVLEPNASQVVTKCLTWLPWIGWNVLQFIVSLEGLIIWSLAAKRTAWLRWVGIESIVNILYRWMKPILAEIGTRWTPFNWALSTSTSTAPASLVLGICYTALHCKLLCNTLLCSLSHSVNLVQQSRWHRSLGYEPSLLCWRFIWPAFFYCKELWLGCFKGKSCSMFMHVYLTTCDMEFMCVSSD